MESHVTAVSCTFCGKGKAQVGKFVTGPGTLRICDECIELSSSILLEKAVAVPSFRITADRSARCTFCGMKSSRVWRMLQGVGSYICSVCIELANLIASCNDERSTNRANVEALQKRNKKPWVWNLSWGDHVFTVSWH